MTRGCSTGVRRVWFGFLDPLYKWQDYYAYPSPVSLFQSRDKRFPGAWLIEYHSVVNGTSHRR